MSAVSGKNDGRFGSGGEKVAEEIILGEIQGMIKGEGAEESAEKVFWTRQGWVREAKEGVICEAQ